MDFITGKHISRRSMLKGMGASFGLPLLDAMIPAGKPWASTQAARDADRVRRDRRGDEEHSARGL